MHCTVGATTIMAGVGVEAGKEGVEGHGLPGT